MATKQQDNTVLILKRGKYRPSTHDDVFKQQVEQNSLPYGVFIDNEVFNYLFLHKWRDLRKINLKIPQQMIWETMRRYAVPIYSEYVETTDNLAFLNIKNVFFEYLFWTGEVYIAKNLDLDENETCNLGCWIKLSDPKEHKFYDLKKKVVVKIRDWEELLIKVEWINKDNFTWWYNFAYRAILGDRTLDNLMATGSKIIKVRESFKPTAEVTRSSSRDDKLLSDLYSEDVYLKSYYHEKNIEFMDGFSLPQLHNYVLTEYHIRDRRLAEGGRVANFNPKGERLTTGENYKDIIAIANRQRYVLDELKLMAGKLKQKYGYDLKFALNGIPERQMTQSDVETVDSEDDD